MCYIGGGTSDSTTGGDSLDDFICGYSDGGLHHGDAQTLEPSFHGFLTAAVAVDHALDITYILGGRQVSSIINPVLWYGNLLSRGAIKSVTVTMNAMNAVAGHGLAALYQSDAPALYVIGGYKPNVGQLAICNQISVVHPTDDDPGPLDVAKVISLRPAHGGAGAALLCLVAA